MYQNKTEIVIRMSCQDKDEKRQRLRMSPIKLPLVIQGPALFVHPKL